MVTPVAGSSKGLGSMVGLLANTGGRKIRFVVDPSKKSDFLNQGFGVGVSNKGLYKLQLPTASSKFKPRNKTTSQGFSLA